MPVCKHQPFWQITGYPQGDSLSPLLFSALLSDLPALLLEHFHVLSVTMYTNDIVLYSKVSPKLMRSVRLLKKYSQLN